MDLYNKSKTMDTSPLYAIFTNENPIIPIYFRVC